MHLDSISDSGRLDYGGMAVRYLINMVADYFRNRSLNIDNGDVVRLKAVVPQGSVLRPTPWNVAYERST